MNPAEHSEANSAAAPSADIQVFLSLFTLYDDRLRGYVARLLGVYGQAALDDVMQEVWCRVFERLDTVRDSDRIRSWLFAIAHNTGVAFHRRPPDAPTAADNVEESAEDAYLASLRGQFELRRLLDLLPMQQRAAILLIDLEEMTIVEAAEVLGCRYQTVASRRRRGHEALRAHLVQYDGGGEK